MKKINLVLGIAIISAIMSCSDDDNSPARNNAAAIAEVVNTVSGGTWRVTLYEEDGVNETNHFQGYAFSFDGNNVLTATGPQNTYTGTWSVTDSDNSNDDSPDNDIDFNIGFTAPANFTDLTDDWDILSRTDTRVQLIDVSGGNGGTDYLTFEKIN